MTTIAEHKLNIIQQIDDLPEESLIELEKIIAGLKARKFNPKQFFAVSDLKNIDKQLAEMREEVVCQTEILTDNKKIYQGKKIRSILEEGAKAGVFSEIENPAQWQKEIREDRLLPGRD